MLSLLPGFEGGLTKGQVLRRSGHVLGGFGSGGSAFIPDSHAHLPEGGMRISRGRQFVQPSDLCGLPAGENWRGKLDGPPSYGSSATIRLS